MTLSKTTKRLGKGLSALMGEIEDAPQNKENKENTPYYVDISKLKPGKFQPRRIFSEDSLRELSESIAKNGVIQPIIVREEKGKYDIIAGERRWRASKMAGLSIVPIIIRNLSDKETLEIALIENIQRQDLTVIEEADGLKRLIDEYSYTQEQLAESVGKSRSHITNLLRVLTLPSRVKDMVNNGNLSLGHAKILLSVKNPEELAAQIVHEQLSVRALETTVRDYHGIHTREEAKKKPSAKKPKMRLEPNQDDDLANIEMLLTEELGMKVVIDSADEGGYLTVNFSNLKELDTLLKKLGNDNF